MALSFGSLFAGVGGADLGFEAAGMMCSWQVENDPACQQILERHWPGITRFGAIEDVNGADIPPVDVIFYGFPCQDLSVAGHRAGLDGDRSILFFEVMRIIREMKEATDGNFPKWAIAENVVGLLSADGGDAMGRCLDTLAETGALVIEWCVLDARFFGVPQRRRRVFIASCFDPSIAERCPAEIFSLAPSKSGHPPTISTPKQATAPIPRKGLEGSRLSDGLTSTEYVVGTYRLKGFGDYAEDVVASPVLARDYKYASDLVTELSVDTTTGAPDFASVRIRGMTPLEAERMQGWPDNHTRWLTDDVEQHDTPRFKQIGNGVASPVAEWVARQIIRGSET